MNVEELLRDSLQEQAARIEYEPTPLEQVAWRARSLRRSRRARAAGVSLVAAAAVATPVVMAGPGLLVADRDRESAQPFASLPVADAPTVEWIDGDRYHAADGGVSDLDVTGVQAFVPFRGGLLATVRADQPAGLARVVTLAADGTVTSDECGSPRLGLDEAAEVAVSLTVLDCSRRWVSATLDWRAVAGPRPDDDLLTVSNAKLTDPVAVRGDITFYNWAELDGSGPGAIRLVTGLGPPELIPGLAAISDATLDGRWVAGTTTDGREVVADAVSGEVRTELGARATAFSPDGQHVAGVALPDGRLEILDAATGARVAATDRGLGTFDGRVAWESPSRLLAVAVDGGQETLVRIALDGTVSRAAEVRPAGSLSLVTQP